MEVIRFGLRIIFRNLRLRSAGSECKAFRTAYPN